MSSFDILTDLGRLYGGIDADIRKASVKILNDAAFGARAGLIAETDRFDRPGDFTKSAWLVDKAKLEQGNGMFALVKAKPIQAQYLWYEIEGGIRNKGDPGATRFDVPVGADAADTDAFGGIASGAGKRISKGVRKEVKARQTLAARRHLASGMIAAAGTDKQRMRARIRLHALEWVVKSHNAPGSFFATINGLRGYWERPERTLVNGPRRLGVRTVLPHGRNTPKLLLQFSDQAKYTPRFRYSQTLLRISAEKMSSSSFGAALDDVVRRRTAP